GLDMNVCAVRGSFCVFSSRRRHTRSKRDWSSDVCSSDLVDFMGGMEMKLLTLDNKGEKQLGVKVGDVVVNVPNALKEKPKQSVAATMETLIEQGEAGLQALEAYVDEVKSDQATYIWKEQDVDFAAAITRPRKIICVGLNYRKHADE